MIDHIKSVPWLTGALMLALLLGAGSNLAAAASFKPQRGINLDQWDTWPDEAQWSDLDVITPFPQWRKHLKRKGFRELKEIGFDFVRMPVDPRVFLSAKTSGIRTVLLDEVRAAINTITDSGLSVIIDLHTMPDIEASGGIERVLGRSSVFEEYRSFVGDMAALVAHHPADSVALELINEPVIDCDGSNDWPDKLKALHATARAEAPETTLVLTGSCWGGAEPLTRLDPALVDDDNTLWTFHSYEPFVMTHQGATWAGNFAPYVTGIPWPWHEQSSDERQRVTRQVKADIDAKAPLHLRSDHKAYLDQQLAEIDTEQKLDAVLAKPFDRVVEWAQAHGIARNRILLGEFGMIRQEYGNPFIMKPQWRAAYYRDMIANAERHGFGWSLWSYGGAFGVVNGFGDETAGPDVLDMVRQLPVAGLRLN
jgi:hypothetical protein